MTQHEREVAYSRTCPHVIDGAAGSRERWYPNVAPVHCAESWWRAMRAVGHPRRDGLQDDVGSAIHVRADLLRDNQGLSAHAAPQARQNSYRALNCITRGFPSVAVYLPKVAGLPLSASTLFGSNRAVFVTLNASARICSVWG